MQLHCEAVDLCDELHPEVEKHAHDHVILIGYGVAGRLVASALRRCGLEYVALELNAETVRRARARDEPVYYGDATSPRPWSTPASSRPGSSRS